MWRNQKGSGRYNKRGERHRGFGRDDSHRRDDRRDNEPDRYNDRHTERHREDESRYTADMPRDFGDLSENRSHYDDEGWADQDVMYHVDRVDDRLDFDRDHDLAYREDRRDADVYDRGIRDPDYDREDSDVYRDTRNFDDRDRLTDGLYDYRDEDRRLQRDMNVNFDDRDNPRDYDSAEYARDEERREFRDGTYDRHSDRRVSDADRFSDRRLDSDSVGHVDRRHEHRDSVNTRRDQVQSNTSRRGNVASGQNRQTPRQRQVARGQGKMKITVGRNGQGSGQKQDKRATGNTRDNRSDKRNPDRQTRNTSRDIVRSERGTILREDRVRSPSSRGSGHRDRSDNKNQGQLGASQTSRNSKSLRSTSRDNKHRQSASQNIKTEKVETKSTEKSSHKRSGMKSKVDNRSRSKDTDRKRKISENSRRSARDQKSHRSNSRQVSDNKQESIKSFGSFHDDDAISILADDDRFANETSSYFNTEKVDSGKSKSEKTNNKRRAGRNTVYEDRAQSSRNKESRQIMSKGFTSNRYASSSYFYRNKKSRGIVNKASGQTSVKDKIPFQSKSSKFANRFNKFKNESNPQSRNISRYGKSFREENADMKGTLDINRKDTNKDSVSVEIGRTGAVLSEDRPKDNNQTYNRRNLDNEFDGNRQGKGKQVSSSKVKAKYIEERRKALKRRAVDEHDDNRDEARYNDHASVHDMSDQTNIDIAQQQQQVIFIPNSEFQDGQIPIIDQFGNPLINPAAVHPGSLQQMPLQFISSNVPGDLPPGSEYVFIPFVNDSVNGLTEGNVNIVNNPNLANDMHTNENKNHGTEEKTVKAKQPKTRASKALLLARKRLRLQLRRKRREEFEKKVERRVFSKLMEKAKLQIDTEEDSNQKTKSKPVLKRISPPADTGRQKSNKRPNTTLTSGKGKYDNVSDVEDITDDEDDMGRSGERRPAFRKPGQPRLAVKGRPAATRTQGDNYEEYERNDTRKVIERDNSRPAQTLEKRNIGRRGDNFSFAKRLKVDKDLPPIKITVSNEKYNQYEDNYDESQENEPYDDRYTRQQRSYDREIKEENNETDRMMMSEVEERDSRNYDNAYRGPGRNEGSYKQGQTDRWQGKYRDNSMPHQRWARFPGPHNNVHTNSDNTKHRWSAQNQGQTSNNNRSQNNRNTPNTGPMSSFSNNQTQRSVSSPFAQQRIPQMNSDPSLPVQYPNLGYQFNSDPSLPPVSQGAMNMPPFGQSNFNPQVDMSLPPMAGGSTANMSGGFHQNDPSQNQMRHNEFNSSQQGSAGSVYNQQRQGQPMNMIGGMSQSSNNMNQQKSFQTSRQGNQQSFNTNNSPQFQQGSFQMNSGSGNMHPQPLIGGMLTVSSQSQNFHQNQQSMTGNSNSSPNTGQQGFITARAGTKNNNSNSANQKTSLYNAGNKSSAASNTNIGYAVRPQLLGSVRGGVIKVPSSSIQGGGMAVMQTGAALSVDNRGPLRGSGDRQQATVQDNRGQQSRDMEEEDDFGELLCSRCDKVFYSESMMRRHNKWHVLADAGVQELRCDNCLEGFTSSVAFGAHMSENHRLTSWMCDKCNIFFVSKLALTRHQSRNH